jgi:ATP-binding protein involved in chromosome partitioning
MQPPGAAQQKITLPNVRYLVAVASGKGGVGKSTVAANLAFALLAQGRRVGLMDADIYGPSLPTMLGIGAIDPQTTPFPLERHGLQVMSMGFLLGADRAAVLRGPMVQRYLVSFLTQLDWGQLDYLLVDMPPGTGDAQLALAQTAPVAGTLIVTTPQEVSLNVARRGVMMFRQVNVPVLGVIENMSYFAGPDGKRHALFGQGGGRRLATECGVPFLGEVPIDERVSQCGDAGEPVVRKYPDAPVSKAYAALAQGVERELQQGQKPQELPELKF